MKKINQMIQLMFFSIALFSSALLAPRALSATGQDVHLGTSNKYKIGTSDNPVRATEYKDFLNDKSSNDHPWIESSYYDSSFMNASNNWSWENNPKACIYRKGTSDCYEYSVISGHENDIIDAVYYQSIQQEFNDWRAEFAKNPTRQELCDYVNDKIAGQLDPSYLDKAAEIQSRYPQAAVYYTNFSTNTGAVTISLWRQVDELVGAIYGTDTEDSTLHVDKKGRVYTTITHTSASDHSINNFISRWGLAVSEGQDASLGFPANMPKHVVVMDDNKQGQQAKWGLLPPSYDNLVDSFTLDGHIKKDLSVTAKIPYNPPAPDNSDTPVTGTQN